MFGEEESFGFSMVEDEIVPKNEIDSGVVRVDG